MIKRFEIEEHHISYITGAIVEFWLLEVDEYPEHSMLAGQERRTFMKCFGTLDKAKEWCPGAEFLGRDRVLSTPIVPDYLPIDKSLASERWDEDY